MSKCLLADQHTIRYFIVTFFTAYLGFIKDLALLGYKLPFWRPLQLQNRHYVAFGNSVTDVTGLLY